MMTLGNKRLHKGELSDAPGRAESWTESVRYIGGGRWYLVVEGTDFAGVGKAAPVRERFGTARLVKWVLKRDAEEHDADELAADGRSRALGPRSKRLLRIARAAGVQHCVKLLEGWRAGTWPTAERPPRIRRVTGVGLRAVWIRISHPVFEVETSAGDGYLYPPADINRTAKLVIGDGEWEVRVSHRLLKELAGFRPALEALRDSKRGAAS